MIAARTPAIRLAGPPAQRGVLLALAAAALAAWAVLVAAPVSMGVAAGMAMWALMVAAMMLPSALPAVAHVGRNSLRWRRRRAMATFAAVYVAVWLAYGGIVLAAADLPLAHGRIAPAAALVLAAAWQLTVHKRRALRDCHRSSPLPPVGRAATRGVVRFAGENAFACLRSCWAMMAAMALAGPELAALMVVVAGIVAAEKLAERPRRATRAGAAILAAAAALVVAAG
jgi:predicted metal-binding membrane protein